MTKPTALDHAKSIIYVAEHVKDPNRTEQDDRELMLARALVAFIEKAVAIAINAKLPSNFMWGRDSMDNFNYGKHRAAEAIKEHADWTSTPVRMTMEEAGHLFADLSDMNVSSFEAYGEGNVPPRAMALYELGKQVRDALTLVPKPVHQYGSGPWCTPEAELGCQTNRCPTCPLDKPTPERRQPGVGGVPNDHSKNDGSDNSSGFD